jgi:hypothetical protein
MLDPLGRFFPPFMVKFLERMRFFGQHRILAEEK